MATDAALAEEPEAPLRRRVAGGRRGVGECRLEGCDLDGRELPGARVRVEAAPLGGLAPDDESCVQMTPDPFRSPPRVVPFMQGMLTVLGLACLGVILPFCVMSDGRVGPR